VSANTYTIQGDDRFFPIRSDTIRTGSPQAGKGAFPLTHISLLARVAPVHRQRIRDDGGAADRGNRGTAFQAIASAGEKVKPIQLVAPRPSCPVRMQLD
jgi:hypothetical protein